MLLVLQKCIDVQENISERERYGGNRIVLHILTTSRERFIKKISGSNSARLNHVKEFSWLRHSFYCEILVTEVM